MPLTSETSNVSTMVSFYGYYPGFNLWLVGHCKNPLLMIYGMVYLLSPPLSVFDCLLAGLHINYWLDVKYEEGARWCSG